MTEQRINPEAAPQGRLFDQAGDGEADGGKKREWTEYPTQKAALKRLPEIGPLAWAVYSILCKRADAAGESYPGQDLIASEVGIKSSRAVRNALARLQRLSLILTRCEWVKGRKRNTYHVVVLTTPDATGTAVPPPIGVKGTAVPLAPEPTFQSNRNLRSYEGSPLKDPQRRIPKERKPAKAGNTPEALRELITLWNGLGPSIVKAGNGARPDPPAKAVLSGWGRAMKDPDQRAALANLSNLATAIRGARACHGQGWFTLPWIFGVNKNGEFNICRILSGVHDKEFGHGRSGNGIPVGPGQRHPEDAKPGRWG